MKTEEEMAKDYQAEANKKIVKCKDGNKDGLTAMVMRMDSNKDGEMNKMVMIDMEKMMDPELKPGKVVNIILLNKAKGTLKKAGETVIQTTKTMLTQLTTTMTISKAVETEIKIKQVNKVIRLKNGLEDMLKNKRLRMLRLKIHKKNALQLNPLLLPEFLMLNIHIII